MYTFKERFSSLVQLLTLIVKDLFYGERHLNRRIDKFEALISVLVAIAVAYSLKLEHVGWAAFSGYMVVRSHFNETSIRGGRRIVGSVIGASVAWMIGGTVVPHLWLVALSLSVGFIICIYYAIISRRGYAWFFMGITFCMVLMDGVALGSHDILHFATARVLEVSIGTLSGVLISFLSTYYVRPKLLGHKASKEELPERERIVWHRGAFWHALQGGAAAAFIPLVWHYWHLSSLSQAGVTIFAVMFVPLNAFSGEHPTSRKLIHRLVGCTSGGAFAFLFLVLAEFWPPVIYVGVMVGIYIGRHIENGRLPIGYIGTQFCLALLVVLIPDITTAVDGNASWHRLAGIIIGLLLLEPVRYLFYLIKVSVRKKQRPLTV